MTGGSLGAALLALGLVGAWNRRAEAADVIIQPGAPSLSANVLLTGADSLKAVGGGTRFALDAHGFGIATAPDWTGTIQIADCDIVNLGTSTTLAIDVHAGAGATFDVERTTFATSGGIGIQATGDIAFKFSNNTIQSNSVVGAAQPSFRFGGTSGSIPKLFQGNRILRSWVEIQNGGNWQVGGASAVEGNIIVGPQAGLRIDAIAVSAVVVRGNYIHATPASEGAVEHEALDAQGDGTLVVEHNVVRGGNGVVGTFAGGELRYNLLGDPSGGAWVVIGSDAGARVHHNIFVRNTHPAQKVTGVSVVAPATNPNSSVYNNTIDGSGTCYGATSRAVSVDENAFLQSLRNNAIFAFPSDDGPTNTALVGPGRTATGALGMKGDPGPARLGYADFNLFYNLGAATLDNYGLSVPNLDERRAAGFALGDPYAEDAKDQQVDPGLARPAPGVFPFDDGQVVSAQVNVCQILAFYRTAYTPGPKSPLIDKGDPMDGSGTDIGAVGAGSPTADDLFGTLCSPPEPAVAPAVVTACSQSGVDASTTDGSTPLASQGRSIVCVCEVASPGSLRAILAPSIALAFLAVRIRPARKRRRR